MKTSLQLAVLSSLAFGTAAACSAPFVKGNEAVTVAPDGSTRVETPPLPKASLGKPCPATKPGCTPSGWRMVETKDGIRECTEFYARPGTCRASTFGQEKRPRQWIVKFKGDWLQCERPDLGSRCVSIKALPNLVVQ
ncbi:hypothetical protein [Paucibacter sp. XJ19-41]|uniref:hypothetical protein n=1 Tax=Paucibacter sp. XJ19-41 TaxID=2927824 RepID=UPI00234B8843|nr:hypothetical protein [Paucibacter sp. XJ19-41]MDC6166586.1 hypothetical protein [Paucibacter sp. XJ19-41]